MTTVITDGTLYLGRNLFGTVTNIKAPEIEPNTLEIKTLGSVGTYSLSMTSVKELKSSATLTGYDMKVFKQIADPTKELTMTIYAEIKEYDGAALTSQKSLKIKMRGTCSKFQLLGEMKAQENIEFPMEFNNTAVKKTVDGKDIYEIDIPNYIYKVNGVDLLAKTKKNLGLA